MESAYTFFDDDMREELTAANLSVDIACQFIKYRDKHNLTQKQLANKLQIPEEKTNRIRKRGLRFYNQ